MRFDVRETRIETRKAKGQDGNALLQALREKKLDYETMDAFDFTPAMLPRFHSELDNRGITRVQLQQADVLALEALPPSWANYDLIISASMLESRRRLARR